MIRHCVFLRFRDDVASPDRQSIYDDLEALCETLPGALAFASGGNVSPEPGMDKGFSEGFIIDFTDTEAVEAYLVHPVHQSVSERLVASMVGGLEGVLVFDLEV